MTATKIQKIFIYIIWLLNIALLITSSLAALMTPMIFDAPGSTESLMAWGTALTILSVPLIALSFTITSIVLFFKKQPLKKTLLLGAFPIVYSGIVMMVFRIAATWT